MADDVPLAGLLDQAGNVFSLVGRLGRAFQSEHQQQRWEQSAAASWDHHAPTFAEFCDALLGLRGAILHPPNGFESVAEVLREAIRIARLIRPGTNHAGFPEWEDYRDDFPVLNSICECGWRAIKEAEVLVRRDDPFAWIDEPGGGMAKFPLTLLDRYPATPAGHLAFLESVRDEVHAAAEAKRTQLFNSYPNATVESMVRGIKWAEAKARVAALVDFPADLVERANRVLIRKLTVGTVEQIDELLTPVVCSLRDAMEGLDDSFARAERIHKALQSVQHELDRWNSSNSPSETGYFVEPVPVGHSLHTAVVALQRFYGGALPRPAINYWRAFLRSTRRDDGGAESEAQRLREWIAAEIIRRQGEGSVGTHTELVEVRTVGDLWKALEENKKPFVAVSAISLGPPFGPSVAQPSFPQSADQSNWDALDRALALCDAEGGDRNEAMRKLIAQVALKQQVDRRQIINMSLAEFVRAAIGDIKRTPTPDADGTGDHAADEMRKGRDSEPQPIAISPSGRAKLFGKADKPTVDGEGVGKLTSAQYDVVLALLRAGENGLTKDELEGKETGRGGGRSVLKRLSEKAGWKAVVDFPGKTGGRYRIL